MHYWSQVSRHMFYVKMLYLYASLDKLKFKSTKLLIFTTN